MLLRNHWRHFAAVAEPFCKIETSWLVDSFEVLYHVDGIFFWRQTFQEIIHIKISFDRVSYLSLKIVHIIIISFP